LFLRFSTGQAGRVREYFPRRRPELHPDVTMETIPQPAVVFPAGEEWPFGATWIEFEKAFNFALFSRSATRVTLLFYRPGDVGTPCFSYELQHPANKTGNIH
jgi:pullulanase/glycogen debranching enzyme